MRTKVGITPAEMLVMREDGLSNRDIANVLDISYSTVLKYIGKQDGRMDSLAAFKATPAKKIESGREQEEMEQEETMPKYSPKAIEEVYRLDGMKIELLHEDGLMSVCVDKDSVYIHYDNVPELVQFLVWAMRERLGDQKGASE